MTYLVTLPEKEPRSFDDFTKARQFAERQAQSKSLELEVIHEATDAVMFVATYVQGRYFNPWERVETPTYQIPRIAGFIPAYTRKRIQATVYRKLDARGWLVHDGRTGGRLEVANTTEARHLCTEMRLGRVLPAPE